MLQVMETGSNLAKKNQGAEIAKNQDAPQDAQNESHVTFSQEQTKKQALLVAHLQLVFSIAKHYAPLGIQFVDLIHEGNRALQEAVETFDHYAHSDNDFSVYAGFWIRRALENYFTQQGLSLTSKIETSSTAISQSAATLQKTSKLSKAKASRENGFRTQGELTLALADLSQQEAGIFKHRLSRGLDFCSSLDELQQHYPALDKRTFTQIEVKALKAVF